MNSIIFAGGCFWGIEEYFSRLKGVSSTKCIYIDGNTENPKYNDLKNHTATHAEAVLLEYNDDIIRLERLLYHFLSVIDPFSLNKQGGDYGIQYRSAIYYSTEKEKDCINNYFQNYFLDKLIDVKVEIKLVVKFYDAEEYHQGYLKKNVDGYCHIKFDTIEKGEEK